ENRLPARHWLLVSLRGSKSNRAGVGARLVAKAGGRQVVRELYPHNGFRSQMPNVVHLGLADATRVDQLTVRWPSGRVRVLRAITPDRHVLIDEARTGPDAVQTVVRGRTLAP